MEETGVTGENLRPVANHCHKHYHINVGNENKSYPIMSVFIWLEILPVVFTKRNIKSIWIKKFILDQLTYKLMVYNYNVCVLIVFCIKTMHSIYFYDTQ